MNTTTEPKQKKILRQEVKDAILANQQLRLKLAYENEKTETTIRNWVGGDSPMLTTAANLDIICSGLGVSQEDVFALSI